MSEKPGIVVTQMEAMLADLKRYQLSQINELIDDARARARVVLREARREARNRVGNAIGAERERMRHRIQMAEAAIQTRNRLLHEKRAKELLLYGGTLLPDALQARWADPDSRRMWCNSLRDEALETFEASSWQIEHPVDWPRDQLDRFRTDLEKRLGTEPEFIGRDDIRGGLRIRTGGACLDGTIDGLLARRSDIDGWLLALFNNLPQQADVANSRSEQRSHA